VALDEVVLVLPVDPYADIAYFHTLILMEEAVKKQVADIVLMEQGHQVYQGVLNQGSHPTVPQGQPAVEIHLFDFQGLLYGQCVRIRYWHFLRDEIAFPSRELMRVQMQQDIADARQWFKDHPDYLAE